MIHKASIINILLDTFEKEFPNVQNITADLENINDIDKDFIIFQDKNKSIRIFSRYTWYI